MDPAQFFSADIVEASHRFRAAAAQHGFAVTAYRNPHLGPAGETLETLVCEFGPNDAPRVLILNSGTHGTEAFVGAGLQLGLLANPAGFLAMAPNTRVVMIHIINPYGAAWGRYVNEDNVDLMKNLTYGDRLSPTDPVFLAFDDAVDLRGITDHASFAVAARQRQAVIDHYGPARVMAALKAGQAARPNSICFNGTAASWSKQTLDAVLSKALAGAERAFFVDLHSGVGGWGEASVAMSGDDASKALVRGWLGDEAHESDVPMDPPCHSTLAEAAPGVLFASAIIEAGTVEFGEDFRAAMWLEMHYHLFGDPLSAGVSLASFQDTSYPQK